MFNVTLLWRTGIIFLKGTVAYPKKSKFMGRTKRFRNTAISCIITGIQLIDMLETKRV